MSHSRMLLSGIQILAFLFNLLGPLPTAKADEFFLPKPGTMVTLSTAFSPPIITGMTIHPENPLQFDFIVDTGDNHLQGDALKKESQKLINYFMATLTVPENEMWVNLSPYEKNRIIANGLGNTEMGRDMLAQDYILKQLTASLIYPESNLGKEFWQKIYMQAQRQLGTTEIPTNLFNKVWIVPQDATVYVNGKNVFVTGSHLKVMLEQDYLSLEKHNGQTTPSGRSQVQNTGLASSQVVRQIVLPAIEKEVNEGKNFANLRQIYNSMILATWYKKKLRNSLLSHIYLDQNKINGIELVDKTTKERIYRQYLSAYKRGVYNYIKEDYDSQTQETIPRKYFSGGLERVKEVGEGRPSNEWVMRQRKRDHAIVAVTTDLLNKNFYDEAMLSMSWEANGRTFDEFSKQIKGNQTPIPFNLSTRLKIEMKNGDVYLLNYVQLGRGMPFLSSATVKKAVSRFFGEGISAYIIFHRRQNGERVHYDPFLRKDSVFLFGKDIKHVYWPTVVEKADNPQEWNEIWFRETAGFKDMFPPQLMKTSGNPVKFELTNGNVIVLDGLIISKHLVVKGTVVALNKSVNSEIEVGKGAEFPWGMVNKVFLLKNERDSAMVDVTEGSKRNVTPGGIDFNADNLNLKEQGEVIEFNFSFKNFQNVQPTSVDGVLPIITNISTVVNFSSLLKPASTSSI